MKFFFHQFPTCRVAAMAIALSILAMLGASNAEATESFVASSANPVLVTGPSAWDGASAVVPYVLIEDGAWYLFYFGQVTLSGLDTSIGFATSADGVNWTKADCNPVLTGDGTGFDAIGVSSPVVRVSEGLWHMYYAGSDDMFFPPDRLQVGYATAPGPCGPWTTLDTPVLAIGSPGP